MSKSKIEWTEETWNPTTGCTKISTGCINCYAEKMSVRLMHMGVKKYQDAFELRLHPNTLEEPYRWKKPKMVFVNSMSDLFHEEIPFDYIRQVFRVMNDNPQHVFQVLTKRSNVLREYYHHLHWTKNIWMGVSVEDVNQLFRITDLRQTNAKTKFLSCEPLLTDLGSMDLSSIDWVIVGGESGPNARKMELDWVSNIHLQCSEMRIPFFFKQWGGTNKKKTGRELFGKIYSEMPEFS